MEKQQAIDFLMSAFPNQTVSVQETVWYHDSLKKIEKPEYTVSVHNTKNADSCIVGYGKTWGTAIGDVYKRLARSEGIDINDLAEDKILGGQNDRNNQSV